MDDVISTGGSLRAMEDLVALAGGTVVARIAVLAEGDAAQAGGHQVPGSPAFVQRRRLREIIRSPLRRFAAGEISYTLP